MEMTKDQKGGARNDAGVWGSVALPANAGYNHRKGILLYGIAERDEMMEADSIVVAQGLLKTFALLFFVGVVAGKLADILQVPDVVLFLFAGMLVGPPGLEWIDVATGSVANQLFLILGAAFLLFHGGTSVRLTVLKEVWLTVLLLATVAVVVMIVVVGYTAQPVLGIGLLSALLLAAVLSSTDPATLVPIFLSIKVRDRVSQTVLTESAFNDATGAIATFAILGVIATGHLDPAALTVRFLIMSLGGILIGAVCGLFGGYIITHRSGHFFSDYAQALVLPIVIASYMAAEHFGASGFMAVFVTGLVYGNLDLLGWKMLDSGHDDMHGFINSSSLLLRMTIFMLLGTHVEFSVLKEYWRAGLIIVAVFMFLARPLAVLCCTLPDRRAKWEKKEILFMFWTRETGVIPAALSGMIVGLRVPDAEVIAAVTFMAILATLAVQASSTRWLAAKLDLLEK